MSSVCVIPARGGSKRIPRKNIKLFKGKPIIAWSIEAALKSGCFDRVCVSTDDPEIAGISQEYGAEIPFMRPSDLSDDYTGTVEVMSHAVTALNLGEDALACCLYATAPFVRSEDIRTGLQALRRFDDALYALSITEFAYPVQRALKVDAMGRAVMLYPENIDVRSQDLEPAWHDAGQFYWGRSFAWKEGLPLFSDKTVPVPLPRGRVQDIDTLDDWIQAERMYDLLHDER